MNTPQTCLKNVNAAEVLGSVTTKSVAKTNPTNVKFATAKAGFSLIHSQMMKDKGNNLMTNKTATLVEALAAAQLEMKNPEFDSTVKYGNTQFRFASLQAMLKSALPPLNKHGIALTQPSFQLDSGVWVIRTTLHKGDQTIFGDMPIIASDNKAQGFGSGVTYAKRYGLSALVGIAADEDDDGGEAAKSPPDIHLISEAQQQQLRDEIANTGSDHEKFLAFFQVNNVREMTQQQFEKAMQTLAKKASEATGNNATSEAA